MLSQLKSIRKVLFLRSRLECEMDAEMQSHIDQYISDLVNRGVPKAEAEIRARAEFGAVEAAQDACRDAAGMRWVREILRDFRYAARMVRKNSAFSIAAILTLGLCIGLNTAIFSVVDATLLRPLPYPEPDRLATVLTTYRSKGMQNDEIAQTGRTYQIIHQNATDLDSAAFSDWTSGVNFAAPGRVEYVQQQRVGAGYFRVLGIRPLIGREFTTDEDRTGGPAVAIIGNRLWRRALNGDPSIVGRTITLRGEAFTVIGIMPDSFQSSVPADLWTPLRTSTTGEGAGQNYGIMARLRDGVSWAHADSQVEVVGVQAVQELGLHPDVSARLRLVSLQRGLSDEVRSPVLMMWAAVAIVLLIGCVNIAGLLLARAAGRTREIATRMSLGSGRAAVLRQMLTESLLLALMGGFVGIGLGYFGLHALQSLGRDSVGLTPSGDAGNLWDTVALDRRVLAATMAISMFTSLIFGLFPAYQASRLDIRAGLAEGGARGSAGARSRWPRRFLVVCEVALGVMLLVGAGLFIRTFSYLRGLRPGFDPVNVLTAKLSLQDARYTTPERMNKLFNESLERIQQIPGVESAAIGLSLPYERGLNNGFVRMDGPKVDGKSQITNYCYVTPDYFRALRIPLLQGRSFSMSDSHDSAQVAVVNDAFVKKYLPEQEAVGSHVRSGGAARVIVGVVGSVQQKSGWGGFGPIGAAPAIYVPAAQTSDKFLQLVHTWFTPAWIVRTKGASEGIPGEMQRALQAVDPLLPFAGFRTMLDVRSRAYADQRFQTTLMSLLAGLALLLAAVGIYGLIANSVVERTRELGIRMALGATVSQAMRTVALPGITLALAGVAIGSVLALGTVNLLRHMIWGVRPTDPATFASVAIVLTVIAGAASIIPALRIVRLNPAETLRDE